MHTEVDCLRTDCKWNKDAKCATNVILIDEGPACRTYEPAMMMVPPVMGGAPGMAPAGGGAAPSSPGGGALTALLAGAGGAGGPAPMGGR